MHQCHPVNRQVICVKHSTAAIENLRLLLGVLDLVVISLSQNLRHFETSYLTHTFAGFTGMHHQPGTSVAYEILWILI